MWFKPWSILTTATLCAVPAAAVVLPAMQTLWFHQQLIGPAVAQLQDGIQSILHGTESAYSDLTAAYIYAQKDVSPGGLPVDLWERFAKLGDRVKDYARSQLEQQATELGALGKAQAFQESIHSVVRAAAPLTAELQATNGVHMTGLSDEIEKALQQLLDKLKAEFPSPDEAPHHEDRCAKVEELYQKAEDEIVKILVARGVPEVRVRQHMERLRPHVVNLIVITGDLAEQHPVLFDVMLAVGVTLILPEQWLLRPLLGLFGWGPYGPVKGSVAAGAQRYFFGASVRAGSWFAILQRAAMAPVRSGWFKTIVGGLLAGAGAAGKGFAWGCR